jgi:hypothetical protein
MKNLSKSGAVLAALLATTSHDVKYFSVDGFSPTQTAHRSEVSRTTSRSSKHKSSCPASNSFLARCQKHHPSLTASKRGSTSSQLQMAAEDFNEGKYTEAAWSIIASLTKAADFYQTTSVEAPLLLDIMLNPTKHSAGENADAARTVTEKILSSAGVDIKTMRSELEKYMSKQARVSGDSSQQKVLGRSMQQVLDAARATKAILGVRGGCLEGRLSCPTNSSSSSTTELDESACEKKIKSY